MHQQPDTAGQGSGNRNLRRVQQRHDVPAEILCGPGRKRCVDVPGDGEERGYDVVRMKLIGLDDRAQQFVGCVEDLGGIVALHGRGAANPVNAGQGGVGHGA